MRYLHRLIKFNLKIFDKVDILLKKFLKLYTFVKVLCGPQACVSWVEGTGSDIPVNAVPGGVEDGGETLYIGRVLHEGTVTVGKIHPSHGVCYVAYGKYLNTCVFICV